MRDYLSSGKIKSTKIVLRESVGNDGFSLKLLIVLPLFIIVAMFFVYQRTNYINTERTIRRLVLEKRKLDTFILPLKLEERHLSRFAKVERAANEELCLYFPEKEQVLKLYIDKSNHKQTVR